MTSLDEFLAIKANRGAVDSEGSFTLDPAMAARTIGLHSLPTPYHFVLKAVQVANRLGTTAVSLHLTATVTRVDFCSDRVRSRGVLADLGAVLEEPTVGQDSLAADLATGLLGAIAAGCESAAWSVVTSDGDIVLAIDSRFATHRKQSHNPTGVAQTRASFVVGHSATWRFWEVRRRRVRLIDLLRQLCAFSPAAISVNGVALPRATCSFFNEHLREFHGSQFNVASGVMQTTKTRVAATSLLFEDAEPDGPSLALRTPAVRSYTRKAGPLCLWTHALEQGNTLRPDGEEACAWMLQRISEGQSVPVLDSEERRFRAVVAFNIHGPGNSQGLRVKIVRHGVLIMDSPVSFPKERLEEYQGCSLLLAEDTLRTDASGFAIVQNQDLLLCLLKQRYLIDLGHDYFEQAIRLIHLP